MDLISILTDGGGRTEETRHYECRACGENLSADSAACPQCDGDVALYTF